MPGRKLPGEENDFFDLLSSRHSKLLEVEEVVKANALFVAIRIR